MLCQNCKREDATTHLKRILGGEAAEIHLCRRCAKNLGVGEFMPGFSSFSEILGGVLNSNETVRLSNKTLRCETCGFSFEDIARTGFPGCPDCYRVFYRKLRPAIGNIHGRAVYQGKIPVGANEDIQREQNLSVLRERLNKAIDEQNFELAAVLRDEINKLLETEGTD
ncbi:MAG: UvrB/UvrC motif-containing protein [Clostridia bacterium]|nr:UvrB/UvrC motif-containing protein [Clostridia bacterium]